MATTSLPAHPSNEIKNGQEKPRRKARMRSTAIVVIILLFVAFGIFCSQLHRLCQADESFEQLA